MGSLHDFLTRIGTLNHKMRKLLIIKPGILRFMERGTIRLPERVAQGRSEEAEL